MVGTQAEVLHSTKLATMPGTRENRFFIALCHGCSLRPPAHENDVRFRYCGRPCERFLTRARSHVRYRLRSPRPNRSAKAIRKCRTPSHPPLFFTFEVRYPLLVLGAHTRKPLCQSFIVTHRLPL